MYKINIVCVGKLKESFYSLAQEEYRKRIGKFCELNIIELTENALDDKASLNAIEKSLEKEALKIEEYLKGFVWVCDSNGLQLDSVQFSNKLIKNLDENGVLTFVIGSSYGLSKKLKEKFEKISFSKLTFPHHLIRIFLLEQIFRAFTIKNNITYHK